MKSSTFSLIAFVFILGFSLSSCKRDLADTPESSSTRIEKPEELDASSPYNWADNKSILITLTGYSSSNPSELGVITILDAKENVLYKGMHSSILTFETELLIPKKLAAVRVKFGTTDKIIPIIDNVVSGTLLPSSEAH